MPRAERFDTLYNAMRPLLFRLDAETAHGIVTRAMRWGVYPRHANDDRPELRQTVWQRVFPNPVGVAAGFDKEARLIAPLLHMGFGFCEIGTVTPNPQAGNDRPRIFRCPPEKAVINALGFPGPGMQDVHANVARFLEQRPRPAGQLGINIGMNKDQDSPVRDYRQLIRKLGPLGDYMVINISSPNTPGLRDLQQSRKLQDMLSALVQERDKACPADPPPLLVKLAPDLSADVLDYIAGILQDAEIDGVILTNTTTQRPVSLPIDFANRHGGLSGRPLFEMACNAVAQFYAATDGRMPIIAAGGIMGAQDAYAMMRAGASLVQLYTGLIYEGPNIAADICENLYALLKKNNFSHISEIVGLDHEPAA